MELTSIFQYSNTYVVTPDITRLYTEKRLQEDCCRAVARDGEYPALVDRGRRAKLDCCSGAAHLRLCLDFLKTPTA